MTQLILTKAACGCWFLFGRWLIWHSDDCRCGVCGQKRCVCNEDPFAPFRDKIAGKLLQTDSEAIEKLAEARYDGLHRPQVAKSAIEATAIEHERYRFTLVWADGYREALRAGKEVKRPHLCPKDIDPPHTLALRCYAENCHHKKSKE